VAIFVVSPSGEITVKESKAMAEQIERVQYFYTEVPTSLVRGQKAG